MFYMLVSRNEAPLMWVCGFFLLFSGPAGENTASDHSVTAVH